MPAFERKQIHHTLSKDEQIKTHSEGDEPYRYLVVEPVKKYFKQRSGRNCLAPRNKKEFPKIAFNFWRISAYFRRSWFCSRRLF